MFEIPSKMRSKKVVAGMDFEVWRQRCSQGAPKGSPRHSWDRICEKKVPKWRPNVMQKVVFFEVPLKAKCYVMCCLRLAGLGGKTYGGCLRDASQNVLQTVFTL